MLKDKRIVLCVTGAISAYKALEVARLLIKEEASVFPVMTREAKEFITPLSLSTLSRNRVSSELFDLPDNARVGHIDLAERADLVLVAPATANFIGKAACGIADDLVTTLVTATTAPVLIAPSMNSRMWDNPIIQGNAERLKSLGYLFVGPDAGELACGHEGRGRLASPGDIVEAAREALARKDLAGEKVLVTAGPTREAIDPVRFVSNASSGRMGYAIAGAARRRGAEVVLVSGPSHLPPPSGVTLVRVTSADEMHEACVRHFPQSTIVVMAAAVADLRPVKSYPKKVKKDALALSVEMERTTDVLKHMGGMKKENQILVGFALETDDMEENARRKLREKNLDLVVANSPAGLDSEYNQATIINRELDTETLPPLRKDDLADRIMDNAARLRS